jgi:hypothetical protein
LFLLEKLKVVDVVKILSALNRPISKAHYCGHKHPFFGPETGYPD